MPSFLSFPTLLASGSAAGAPAAAGTCPPSAGPAGHPGTPGHRCAARPAGRSCRPRRACSRPGCPRPAIRHIQCRRVVHEVEQVIKPAARIGHRPAVKLGLHPGYPRPRPFRSRARGRCRSAARLAALQPPSLPETTAALPMCTGFSRLGVLRRLHPASGRSADSEPSPDPRAGRARPGRLPCSLRSARRRRSPALPLRPRHGYPAALHLALPAGIHMRAQEFPPPY
jgi:hypothetical protein